MNADRDRGTDRNPDEDVQAQNAVRTPRHTTSDAVLITTPDVEPRPSVAELANPVVEADMVTEAHGAPAAAEPKRRRFTFGLDRFSGLYVWAALIILFSIWVPDTFPTTDNAKIVAGDQAITAMLALGIIIPLAAGVFDLSFAGVLGVSVAINAYMQTNGHGPWLGAIAALAAGAFVGAVNGFVVVYLRVNSFIATLGMSTASRSRRASAPPSSISERSRSSASRCRST
jgi:Branched-chain amino acid transport system / permease component